MAVPRVIQQQIDDADAYVAQMTGKTEPKAETKLKNELE